MHHTRRMATLRRSLRLLRSFPYEQFRPRVFYSSLARDTRMLIDALANDLSLPPGTPSLRAASVLDVGGGPGYFAEEFADCFYVGVEPSVSEMSAAGLSGFGSVRGDGAALPFADDTFDVVYSSNVAEHIPNWQTMGAEMLRVAKPGGLVVLSYTCLLYTSPSPRDRTRSRMPSSA